MCYLSNLSNLTVNMRMKPQIARCNLIALCNLIPHQVAHQIAQRETCNLIETPIKTVRLHQVAQIAPCL